MRGILLGDKQYSPVKDFSAAREVTDSEEAAAMEAISLSKDIGGLSNLLQERGYDKDQIFKLLNLNSKIQKRFITKKKINE